MAVVIAFAVLSQLTAALVVRAWGAMADRFSTRAVLRVSCAVFLLAVACGGGGAGRRALAGDRRDSPSSTSSAASPPPASTSPPARWPWSSRPGRRGRLPGHQCPHHGRGVGAGSHPGRTVGRLAGNPAAFGDAGMDLDRRDGRGTRLADRHARAGLLFLATVVVGLYAIHRILGQRLGNGQAAGGARGPVRGDADQMPQPLRAITTVPTVRDPVYFPSRFWAAAA